MSRNMFFVACLGALLSISAAPQSVSMAPYAEVLGVHNVTSVSPSKACPFTVNGIHDILQHVASIEVVTYKWVPICGNEDWWRLQGKYPRTRVLHDMVDMPGNGARYFVNTSYIVRDPEDGIVFVNVRMRSFKDVERATTYGAETFNSTPGVSGTNSQLGTCEAEVVRCDAMVSN